MHLSLIIAFWSSRLMLPQIPVKPFPPSDILATEYGELSRTWVVEQYLTHGAGKKFDRYLDPRKDCF